MLIGRICYGPKLGRLLEEGIGDGIGDGIGNETYGPKLDRILYDGIGDSIIGDGIIGDTVGMELREGNLSESKEIPAANSLNVLDSALVVQEGRGYVYNEGTGEFEGQAYPRQSNRGVVTCAGYTVSLVPVTTYSTERIGKLYGDTISGFSNSRKLADWNLFDPPDSDYLEQMRQTTCDANGAFKFVDVPDGDFFVLIDVAWATWNPDRSTHSGSLMRRITLREGKRRIKVQLYMKT